MLLSRFEPGLFLLPMLVRSTPQRYHSPVPGRPGSARRSRKHGKANWRKHKAVPLLRYRDAGRNPGWGTCGRFALYGEHRYVFPPTDSPAARAARSRLIKKRWR